MNKKLVKRVAVASLTALISVPNIITPTQAAYNAIEQQTGVSSGRVISSVNQGQYTLVNDDWGYSYLVNSNQWQEYQSLLQQGYPEVVLVITTDFNSEFHTIDSYQLKGQPEVKLPKNNCIKVTDKYNCDQLTVLKHVGNQLGTSYLYNQQKWFDDIDKKNAQIYADIAKQKEEQKLEAEREQQMLAENEAINKGTNLYSADSKKSLGNQTSLKYSKDYLQNYTNNNRKKSYDKIWASFDNERNYVQKWLTKHGFKNLKELENIRYNLKTKEDEEKSAKYSSQSKAAQQYYKNIESGVLSQNCSMGDWIRYLFTHNPMGAWNGLVMWTDNEVGHIDFSVVMAVGNDHNLCTYEDAYKNNREIQRMIEENMPIIANIQGVEKEQKTNMINSLCAGSSFIEIISSKELSRKYVSEWKSVADIIKEIKNKWNTEYLPNIKD